MPLNADIFNAVNKLISEYREKAIEAYVQYETNMDKHEYRGAEFSHGKATAFLEMLESLGLPENEAQVLHQVAIERYEKIVANK